MVLANEGMKLPVSLLKVDEPPKGERVMNPRIARQMIDLLESVVASKAGTGYKASVPGYRVAGKTGTALKAGAGGYQKHHYTSTFVGMAPASHPRLVVAVVIHEPSGKFYYGGDVAGPAFEKIMEGTLRILSVPPDAEQPVVS
jgi:cell division protein FtsI (penicillin-binding protein 3)